MGKVSGETIRSAVAVSAVLAAAALGASSSLGASTPGRASASVASSGRAPSRLQVDVSEWNVVPSQGLVAAGRVRVTVRDYGRRPHELQIVRTATWGDRLQVRAGRAVSAVVGRRLYVAPGGASSQTVTLRPGSYVLLDNFRGHYARGTWVALVVR